MAIPSGPKGTRDFYPEDSALQEFIFNSWRRTCSAYGFEPYEGPMFESLELYTKKSGAEIEKQLYSFMDKGGRSLALRPEMTPTIARMVAAKGNNLGRPIRWYSIPRLFRYEKMQKGRLREFFQLNMDILGIAEVSADAELIAAAVAMMRNLGFTANDFKVRISSRTLLEELLAAAGLPADRCPPLYALLDRKSKISESEFSAELERLVPEEQVRSRVESVFLAGTLEQIAAMGTDLPAAMQLRELFTILSWYGLGKYVVFDIGIVRGLAYYTGIVFEIIDIKKNLRAIAGGGRYDRLVESYGGVPTPAVGFAAGDVVLAELMKSKGIGFPMPPRSACYLVSFEGMERKELIMLAGELRNHGISCEFSLKDVNVGKQLKMANAARSAFVLFVGGDEAKAGNIRVKDMSTGEEFTVSCNAAVNQISELVEKNHIGVAGQ